MSADRSRSRRVSRTLLGLLTLLALLGSLLVATGCDEESSGTPTLPAATIIKADDAATNTPAPPAEPTATATAAESTPYPPPPTPAGSAPDYPAPGGAPAGTPSAYPNP